MIITIDGPSGSGKSTLSVKLAKYLGFFCLNGGYLYRAIAYILKTYYGYTDEMLSNPQIADVQAIFDSGQFRYDYIEGVALIFWGHDDITKFLKKVENGKAAAIIAQNGDVRKVVQQYERNIVQGKDAVVEGRACGSTTFFDADLKLYVTASLEVRAKRAVIDQAARGNVLTEAQALEHIVARDNADMNRKHDPLVIPQGAVILDTSIITQDQVLQEAVNLVRKAMKKI